MQDCKSLIFDRGDRIQSVGFYGIICPVRNKEICDKGIRLVRASASDVPLEVEPVSIDPQGREYAWVLAAGENLNLQLVRKGLAYWDRNQAPFDQDLSRAETQAREERIGIWSYVRKE
jgi:hypothetical protein